MCDYDTSQRVHRLKFYLPRIWTVKSEIKFKVMHKLALEYTFFT